MGRRTCNKSVFAAFWIVVIFCGIVSASDAAGGSKADYERAANLSDRFGGKVFGARIRPNWLDDSTMWYRRQTGKDKYEFIFVDAEKGTQQKAFDHDKLADALKKANVRHAERDCLPVRDLKFDISNNSMQFAVLGIEFRCDLDNYNLTRIGVSEEESLPNLIIRGFPLFSYAGGDSVEVLFENRMDEEVELFWCASGNNLISYGTLKPGQVRTQNTYVGHVWYVKTTDGRDIAVFRADGVCGKALIDINNRTDKPPKTRKRSFPFQSPDGKWTAIIRDDNVFVVDNDTETECRLTTDGTEDDAYMNWFHFSPDSKKLVVGRVKKGQRRKVYFVESSPNDQVQPKLHSYNYDKPGDVIDIERPCLFDLETKKQIPVRSELFDNPYRISDYKWDDDSSRFMFTYNQRGHQIMRVVAVDARSGAAGTIIEETSETFICYSSKYYCKHLDKTNEIVWMSERDGFNHLYLYDSKTGAVKNQITKGKWVVRNVDLVDESKRQIWFAASGIYPDQDPYYVHYCRVNFDGSGLTILTEGDGTHTVEYSHGRKYMVDTFSRVDAAPIHQLRRCSDGKLVCELGRADFNMLLDEGWKKPIPFSARGRDGKTDIYGVIYRPTNFDAGKSYPVIEKIYAGPQDSFVPKKFSVLTDMQSLAELGFIVVQIDGMGTSNRSKAFHDVCWKNLADAGLPDRIAWIKAAAKKYPYMDITRIGIYGGSAGGQSAASAVFQYGDFYKAAAADCGCHDNRVDKLWWNEQWMGWPVGPEYKADSNVTLAKNLKGKLLLIVGEMDRNVDPASTMQVVDALIKADKDFELLVVPGAGHNAAELPYVKRRRADFFVRHLLGVEPRR